MNNRLAIGILAHVDAGKTTLSEALLYKSGSLRKLGRVDNRDAFLDTEPLERERGITIFAKQAVFPLSEKTVTLLDTPGHADFSAETERTLWVLDYAILVVSGADGVQGHTETLWKLLKRYRIPTFLFINKTDQPGTDREKLLNELQTRLSDRCLDFTGVSENGPYEEPFSEAAAICDEALLERYLETGAVTREDIAGLIAKRKLFPCFFGSALKLTGVEAFLAGLSAFTVCPQYPEEFAAKVYKIARDAQGNRLSYMKITGGSLPVKSALCGEKAEQIRIYSGAGYESVGEAAAGTVCAVLGLKNTEPGMGLGAEADAETPVLEPVLSYRLTFPPDCDIYAAYLKLQALAEEEPELRIEWNGQLGEIHAKLMGEIQAEILKRLIAERFGLTAGFSEGHIVYKETITKKAVGIGHFEPLRHYAEVHLLLEPLPRGSGLLLASNCREEQLSGNWQRLVLSMLANREPVGVLTGAPVTDVQITLIAGRSHLKHTEGGDFREAAFRAVRQGLMQAESILLEPYYAFTIEVPQDTAGRALTDIQRMCGEFEAPVSEGETAVIRGFAPVVTMQGYPRELVAYTRGYGRISLSFAGYRACHNQEEVLEAAGYDPERDAEHPAGSVFCAHGAGFYVNWQDVPAYAHAESGISSAMLNEAAEPAAGGAEGRMQGGHAGAREQGGMQPGMDGETKAPAEKRNAGSRFGTGTGGGSWESDRELEEIFRRTFGAGKHESAPGRGLFDKTPGTAGWKKNGKDAKRRGEKHEETGGAGGGRDSEYAPRENYLLVDGYNIIHAWEELKELAALNFDAARTRLLDILCNYQGYTKCRVIVVFDAYNVPRYTSEVERYQNIYVVYTKQAETADQYIAKTVTEISKNYNVTVATSDRLVQLIILGQGALRLSARELHEAVEAVNEEIRRNYLERPKTERNRLLKDLSRELAEKELPQEGGQRAPSDMKAESREGERH